MKLEDDFSTRATGCKQKAKVMARWANSLYFCAVLSSAAATIVAAADLFPKEVVAVIAAIPGIISLTLNTYKPDARSQWWWAKWHKFDQLIRDLRYGGKIEKDANKEWNEFIKAHETKYPGWGNPPSGTIA
jgi:hypothetical protein